MTRSKPKTGKLDWEQKKQNVGGRRDKGCRKLDCGASAGAVVQLMVFSKDKANPTKRKGVDAICRSLCQNHAEDIYLDLLDAFNEFLETPPL